MTFKTMAVWVLLVVGMSGCTIKATTDTTTDGTSEFLSSTSGKTWWTEDGLVKHGEQAGAFVSVNFDNLLQDIAKGKGEYLSAFGTILHVPFDDQQVFANRLQQHYADLSEINARQGDREVKQFIKHVAWVGSHPSTPSL